MQKFLFTYILLVVSLCGISQGNQLHLSTVSSTITFIVEDNTVPITGASINMDKYGSILTDSIGVAIFEGVDSPDTLEYSVSAENYITVQNQIIVGESDITKYVNLQAVDRNPNVTFYVGIGDNHVEGAKVTFHTYGTQKTDLNGKTTFSDITSGIGLIYTVEVPEYSLFEGSLIVGNEDIYEEIKFAPPSFMVLFNVNLNDEPFEEVEITLEGYGTTYTNKYGFSRYLNVYGENVPYTIITERHGSLQGSVRVTNSDVTVLVEFTGILDKQNPKLEFYPNPASDYIEFSASEEGLFSLHNSAGTLLKTETVTIGKNLVGLDALKTGIYIVHFKSDKQVLTGKLIIE